MRLLLDTCALVALAEREPMRDEAVEAIRAAQASGEIFVPAVTAFEVAQKMAVGKFTLAAGRSARAWFEAAVKRGRFRQLPVTADLALTVYELPEPFHEDPADRLIHGPAAEGTGRHHRPAHPRLSRAGSRRGPGLLKRPDVRAVRSRQAAGPWQCEARFAA